MIEFEKKVLLTRQEYLILLDKVFSNATCYTQTNYYYDTDTAELSKKGITCRIREKNGEFTATIKEHSQTEKNKSLETTYLVKNEKDDKIFCYAGIKLQGKLTTKRVKILKNDNVALFLDLNNYLGIEDYELEIEYLDGFEKEAEQVLLFFDFLLFQAGLRCTLSSFKDREGVGQSKSARFFTALQTKNFKN